MHNVRAFTFIFAVLVVWVHHVVLTPSFKLLSFFTFYTITSMTACCTASDINTVGIRYINFDIFSLYYRLVFIVFCLDREYGYSHTGNGIGWQFSSGKHDVTKVESGVVDTTELPVRVMGWTEVFEWWLDPLQTGQIAAGPHVDERFVSLYQTLLACYKHRN